ncbi:MAG: Nif3-like dinuclear metal center hexameric protein [Propionibacteriaceae bacterium]
MGPQPGGDRAVTTVGDVVALIDRRYPFATAESWDRVGLVTGALDDPVSTVLGTVDVTDAVVAEAEDRGAQLILAHHPLLLHGVSAVRADEPKGRLLTRLIRSRIALLTAHTNADVPAAGVADALADALGLTGTTPLRPRSPATLDKITTTVPPDHLDAVLGALADAGAGAIGTYDRAAFTTTGTGQFRPLAGSDPFLGRVGEVERVPETRLEMIMERARRGAVVAALLAVHPYQTPAYDVVEVAPTGAVTAGLGRVGDLAAPCALAEFAARVVQVLPRTPAGIRVAGDPGRVVRRIAVQAGAGDDLFAAARDSGADVYLTSDLRHHPASEALAYDGSPALVDVSHWAAEWTWLPVLAGLLHDVGLQAHVSTICTDPWTSVFR